MSTRNLLKPGDFVSLVPNGLYLTLQYNSEGNLQKVYQGFDDNREDVTKELLPVFVSSRVVPLKIHITKGTSWVKGVLYTGKTFTGSGKLPDCTVDELKSYFIKSPDQFNFFAGDMNSTATVFVGINGVRQCLSLARFHLLPGWLVPAYFSDQIFDSWLGSNQFTFNPHTVTGLMINRKGESHFESTNLSQYTISKSDRYTDRNGYIGCKLTLSDSSVKYVDYSDVVKFQLEENTLIILDDLQITHSIHLSNYVRSIPKQITCDCCGKSFESPLSGKVQCPDIHCISRIAPKVDLFLSTLNLPQPKPEVLESWIKNKDILSVPDILILPEYKDIKVETTLSKLLRSMVPIDVIPRSEVFTVFANGCTNNIKTFRYYVTYPSFIVSDLGISHVDLPKLVAWLSDGCNACDLTTLLDSPQIQIKEVDKRFEGAPIFRGKTLYVTGKFIRGDHAEIAAILQSYSAKVTTVYTEEVDGILVGSKNEDIDGVSINNAKKRNIPVMEEDSFFLEYGIDDDLRANLVYNQ